MLFFALALLLLLKFLWVAFFLCHPIYFNHNDYNDSINNNNNHNDKSNSALEYCAKWKVLLGGFRNYCCAWQQNNILW